HVVTYAAAAGAIPAFGSYLPAFFAFFLPAGLPFLAWSLLQSDSLHTAAAFLSTVFMVGMAGLGWRANRSFREGVHLRLE
ncbi:hypothetical protein OFC37_35680, partial [Escherichia coli]|nr:hypothetical protein [Escherichia coli]